MSTLSALVHAASKAGKSTLTSTAPLPICVLDAEGGWRFIREAGFRTGVPLRKITWDPVRDAAPPRWDGTWDVCVVTVTRWETLTKAYVGFTQYPHDFRSLVLDSITESQRRLKRNLRGMEQMRIQDWGDLLTQMDQLIRDMRDLVLIPGTPLRLVMFVAETKMKDGKWRPQMQGQIGDSLPYWMDIVGYLYRDTKTGPDGKPVLDANGQPVGKTLKMLIGQDVHPQIEAGERVQGVLGDIVVEPHLTEMMKTIYGADTFDAPVGGK
jgi:hypothetical protein